MNPDPTEELRSVPAAEGRALLEEQQQSDLSIAAFARQKGVKPWVLYNAQAAKRRNAKRERSSQFTEIQVVQDCSGTAGESSAIELALPSGVAVRVRRDFDEIALRRLLGVLGSC